MKASVSLGKRAQSRIRIRDSDWRRDLGKATVVGPGILGKERKGDSDWRRDFRKGKATVTGAKILGKATVVGPGILGQDPFLSK